MKYEDPTYYVVKLNCPHYNDKQISNFLSFVKAKPSLLECNTCKIKQQNWICVTCCQVECSRYANGHMLIHNQTTHHPVAFSSSQLAFWCYACQDFIDQGNLMKVRTQISKRIFQPHQHQDKHEKEVESEEFKDFGVSAKTIQFLRNQDINLELLMLIDKEEIQKFSISKGDQLRIISHLKK